MKTILLLLAALLASTAQADCGTDLLAKFEQQRATAINLYPQHAARLAAVTAHMDAGGEVSSSSWAHAKPLINLIVISREVCDLPSGHRNSIIAHEIGHIISDAESPDLLQHEMQFPKRHDYARDEELARYYGAKLITQADRDDMLAVFAGKCTAGANNYCQLQASWEYGFTH